MLFRSVSQSRYHGYGGWDWDDDWSYRSYNKTYNTPVVTTEKDWFHDNKFNYVSSFERNKLTKKIVSVDLCEPRIMFEEQIIKDLLIALEIDFDTVKWDGFTLTVNYNIGHKTTCDRNDLIEYLP